MANDVVVYSPENKSDRWCTKRCQLATYRFVHIGLDRGGPTPKPNTVKMCGDCGRFWLVKKSWLSSDFNQWVPVRWYHINAQMRIKNA